ncbi:hypothetical protein Dimus_002060 [Dionaea muscipula]
MTAMAEEVDAELVGPIFRDIRRYYCQYCGICRSKKSLINTHIQSHHQDEVEEEEEIDGDEMNQVPKLNVCEDCGASFKKPAHLKQHMQSHSLERPFGCPVDDCQSSYRRKDHLNRHLLQHQGKLFKCPIDNCDSKFSVQANIKRHLTEIHNGKKLHGSGGVQEKKMHVCGVAGCGKKFLYESRLRKHENSHVELDSVEAFCAYPSCMKPFTNIKCLKAHLDACHQHVTCEICGSMHLRKNIKRHLRSHEEGGGGSPKSFKCTFEDCDHTFTKKSNLQQHVKAVHLELRRFACGIPGCNMRFTFKHVRDNHEKAACHGHVDGDLEEFDEQFRSRPRGGRKRQCPAIDTLTRKRVCPPLESDVITSDGSDYLSWLLSPDGSNQ